MEPILSLPVSGAATAVAWSPDGSRLAAASNYGEDLTVWDASGHIISQFSRSGSRGRMSTTRSASQTVEDHSLLLQGHPHRKTPL